MNFWRITKWAQLDPQTPTGEHGDDVTSDQQRRTHSFTQWTNSDPPPPTAAKGVLGVDNPRSRVPFYFPTRAKRKRPQEYIPVTMATDISPSSSPPSPPTTLFPAHTHESHDASDPSLSSDNTQENSSATTLQKTPTRDPESYPTPPTSDGLTATTSTSPLTTTDNRDQATSANNMPLPTKDFYPASAYGPQGPRGYAAGAQAAQDTIAMAASGQFSNINGSPMDRDSDSTAKRGPPQFFSEPPMPVYHNQPQTTANYYPGTWT